jgi:hypothetical protein
MPPAARPLAAAKPAAKPAPAPAPAAPARGLPPLPAGRAPSAQQLLRYERKGHLATRGLLSAAELAPFVAPLETALAAARLDAFRHRVSVLCAPAVAAQAQRARSVEEARALLAQHAHDDVGFLQARAAPRAARAGARSARLAAHAAPALAAAAAAAGVQPPPAAGHARRRRGARAGGAARARRAPALSPQTAVDSRAASRPQTSARLGAMAAQLLGVRRVRLYQSCVFIKEPGMGDTNWHSGAETQARADAGVHMRASSARIDARAARWVRLRAA